MLNRISDLSKNQLFQQKLQVKSTLRAQAMGEKITRANREGRE